MTKRVLVVDDDALLGLEIAQQLTDVGLEVVGPAISVARALRLMGERVCDAAVLDVNLGSETAEPVALELRARRTPFVVLSGYSSEQHPPSFHGAPQLIKPIRPEELVAMLRKCMHRPLQQLRGGPVHILLVEDDSFLSMDVAETLRRAGFQVIETPDADAAMEFINSGDRIDLVLTDVWTPGVLNGLDLAERIRAKFPMMPVIITSSNTKVGDAASRLGRFVLKPYEPTGVANMIAQIVGSSL